MKKSMLIIIVFGFFCTMFAVNNFGIKGGINFSNINGDDVNSNFKSKTGFNIGVFAHQRIVENISFQEEFLFTQKGTKIEDGDYEIVEDYNYIEIPLLFKVRLGNVSSPVSLYGGPSFSFLTSAKNTTTYNNYSVSGSIDNNMNNFDFGVNLGADIRMERFFFDIRYTQGLTRIYTGQVEDFDLSSLKVKNKVIAAGVGFIF